MTFEERLDSLERQNRNLRKLAWGAVAIALAAFIGGTALSVRAYTAAIEPTSISTTSITLRDASNRARINLSGANGQILMADETGRNRVILGPSAGVRLYDENAKMRAVLTPQGALVLYDANTRVRASLGSDGVLRVFDDAGKNRMMLHSNGSVSAFDSGGIGRVILDAATNKIYFRNASGAAVATIP